MIGREPRPSETYMARTRENAEILIPVLREVARQHGYALAAHGSLERDIDILLAPWTDTATAPQSVIEQFYRVANAVFGRATWDHGAQGPAPEPTRKPHGRIAWCIHFGITYLDVSVMPRVQAVPAAPPAPTGRRRKAGK